MKFIYPLFCLFTLSLSAQNLDQVGIGQWKSHMSLSSANDVAVGHNKVYTSFVSGIMTYDLEDNSYNFLSKVNGLSSINLTQVEFIPTADVLVIGYADGNLDIIKNDLSVINLSDIKRSNIIGDKSIYKIAHIGAYVYICTGFGVVVLDPIRFEFKDTYIFGPGGTNIKVNSIASDGTNLFAATDIGLFSAQLNNPFLANFTSWTKDNSLSPFAVNGPISNVAFINGYLAISREVTGYNNDSIYLHNTSWNSFTIGFPTDVLDIKTIGNRLALLTDGLIQYYDNNLALLTSFNSYSFASVDAAAIDFIDATGTSYIADKKQGLVRRDNSGNSTRLIVSSPYTVGSIRVAANKGSVWLTHDGFVGVNVFNSYLKGLTSGVYNGNWVNLNSGTSLLMNADSLFDAVSVVIDPKDENHVFMGSYSYKGITEILNGEVVAFHDETNSAIESAGIPGYNAISAMDFDDDGNLWIVNSRANSSLIVKKADATWKKFDLGNNVKNKHIFDLEVGKSGLIWVALPTGNNNGGLMVFDHRGTIDDDTDDRSYFYVMGLGSGNLPSLDVKCVTEDLDEEIWIGTANGLAVIYNQFSVFEGSSFDAQQILIEQDGNVQILLENEVVTDIEIDGANRKWIGTEGSGVYLLSEDGTEEIMHLTSENSPLLGNIINDIAIDHSDGTVYFATSDGLISLRYTATSSENAFQNVVAFPNPINHDYDGIVAVKGLSRNSDFKITDISGNIVFHGISEGGTAIWDLKDIRGVRVSTGVYLVYCNSENGSKDAVAKLLIIN